MPNVRIRMPEKIIPEIRYGVVLKTYNEKELAKYYIIESQPIKKGTVLKSGTTFWAFLFIITEKVSYYAAHNHEFEYIIPAELVMELTEEEYEIFKQLEKEDA